MEVVSIFVSEHSYLGTEVTPEKIKEIDAQVKEIEGKRITGAPFYPLYYVEMAKTCRLYGYALTVHGSMMRDLDLVAIPWTAEAVDEKTLIDELIHRHDLMEGNPTQKDKPHGRRSYVFIGFGGEETGYIDFSVMPRVSN
jgi:hypothetical protein